VYVVVPFPKKIQRVTIQGSFGWYSTYLPKFGVEVVMVYKPSACFTFFYIDFVSMLPRLAAKERKWNIPSPKVGGCD